MKLFQNHADWGSIHSYFDHIQFSEFNRLKKFALHAMKSKQQFIDNQFLCEILKYSFISVFKAKLPKISRQNLYKFGFKTR